MSCALCHKILLNLQVLGDDLIIDQGSGRFACLSYRQAGQLIARLDQAIKALDKQPITIGILSNHRAEAYLSVLYAFLHGIKFVPLNPGLPVTRLQRIIELANVDLIIYDESQSSLASALEGDAYNFTALLTDNSATAVSLDAIDCEPRAAAESYVYHMFTSGSSGEPKGVPITHNNLSAYVSAITDFIAFPEKARFSQFFDLSFDLAIHDIFVAAYTGGTLVPPSRLDLLMPANYIEKRKIDVWFSVPVLAQMAYQGHRKDKHRHKLSLALFCGEALASHYIRNFSVFMQRDSSIYNLYGPTEGTIAFTGLRLGSEDYNHPIVPIGLPFGENVTCLYRNGRVVETMKEGHEGELLLGGPQVFHGYQPAQEGDIFVEADGKTFYRSGDLVRLQNGIFHHLGRIDDQFKIRGHRVEYGEIEAAYRQAFQLKFVAAFTAGDFEEKHVCLAYVSDRPVDDVDTDLPMLPDYMRPREFFRLEHIPTNINGKIDRQLLRAIAADSQ